MTTQEDRWLLPRRQTECPGRDVVPEATLHARREGTFLVLAALAITATTAMILLAAAPVLDLSSLLQSIVPSVELTVDLALPVGIAASACAIVAALLVCELYGRRRATALVWASLFAAGASIGVLHLVDLVTGRGTGIAFAFASYLVAAQLVTVLAFSGMRGRLPARRQWTRRLAAVVLGQIVGVGAFAGALYGDATLTGAVEVARINALTAGSAAAVLAASIVLLVPAAIAAHALGIYLRVERFASEYDDDFDYDEGPQHKLAPAMIVDNDGASGSGGFRAPRVTLRQFSTTEQMFFSEGDQLVD